MAIKKFNEWIMEQEVISNANNMSPGGNTQMAGNQNYPPPPPPLANSTGNIPDESDEPDDELKQINSTLKTALVRLGDKISRLKNKKSAVKTIEFVLDYIHTQFPNISKSIMKKVVDNTFKQNPQQNMQQNMQNPQQNMQQNMQNPQQNPHMPPGVASR